MDLKNHLGIAFLLSSILFFTACNKEIDDVGNNEGEIDIAVNTDDDADFVATDWTKETHSRDVEPNFDEVFSDTEVKRLDIVVTEDRWQTMLDDMTNLYGTFGRGSGSFSDDDPDPVFVPASIFYNGIEWYSVGIRFKGNSSLANTWADGNLKLSFKLDFDEFEDDYPQIDNQRFYGFKKFSLKNNFEDESMLREKVATDVFREAGVASSHAGFYTLYVDAGDGPQYFGLYTLVEEVDDTVIETQFTEDGNLYKPDGDAASFATGTFDEDEFVKKTNEDEADFRDVENFYDVLHEDARTTDAATWRANLDAVFDTDTFLKYLAVNTIIQNWDTYGRMTHNYYLYNNPDTNTLTWIPWDNNEAFDDGKQGGAYPLNFLGLTTVEWPIIGYMYNDDVYRAKYDAYVKEVIEGAFETSKMQALYTTYASLIEEYAIIEEDGYTFLESASDFQAAVTVMKNHASERAAAVSDYLD